MRCYARERLFSERINFTTAVYGDLPRLFRVARRATARRRAQPLLTQRRSILSRAELRAELRFY